MANPVFPNLKPSEGKKPAEEAKGQQPAQQQPPRHTAPPPVQQGANPYQNYWSGPKPHPSAPQQGRAPVGHGHRKQT